MDADRIRVLLVENEGSATEMVGMALMADAAFTYLGYVSSRAALDDFLKGHALDLALVDLGLPRPAGGLGAGLYARVSFDDPREGLLVIDRLRELSPQTVVVAFSGLYHTMPYLLTAVCERGAKPVAKQEGPIGPQWSEWLRRELHVAMHGNLDPSPSLTRLLDRAQLGQPCAELPLTFRQLEVARLYVEGCGDGQIADRLTITEDAVRGHFRGIRERLNLHHRWQLKSILSQHWEAVLQVTRHLDGR